VEKWVELQFAATPLAALIADRDPAQRAHAVGLVSAEVGAAPATLAAEGAFSFQQEVHVALADG
jgi:hypothetical protein